MAAVIPLSALESRPRHEVDREADARPKALNERVVPGRLSELAGGRSSGRTTAAVSLVIRAQSLDEPVVWVQPRNGSLYPPDLADSGVDLDALVVVNVPPEPRHLARAAELLLRSGAFGLVVVDLTAGVPRGDAWQGRLSALARQHDCRVVLLSEVTRCAEEAPSLGPMVGLRVMPSCERRAPGRYVVSHRLLKDKLGGPPLAPDKRRAPWGLP